MPDPKHPIDRVAAQPPESNAVLPGVARPVADDHDSPWKEALEIYFEPALRLLAPDLHAVIDWSTSVVFLDKELQATSLSYQDGFLNQQTLFTFPIVELEAWRDRWDELDRLAPVNPFAVMIMAQLQASGHPDKATRLAPLIGLTRRLYDYGYSRERIGQLLRLVEWVIGLASALEIEYHLAARQLEQEHKMSYVTIAERYGMAKGVQEGQANLLLGQIQRRFGPLSENIIQRIHSAKASQLETWSLNFVDATELDDVFRD
ncbi:MAG TPA: DUF4351 domain-containing protein [Castellaniella sp.]|uniref:DUF4351 domain-containing protein n=1 Tax=Castellaniella sp. TaxID=1955812 RepID=UPI002F1A3093